MRLERFRERAAGSHAVEHVVEYRPEHRVGHPAAKDVERLHQRHPGLEQRGQLLVEHQELTRGDPRSRRQRQRADRQPPRTLDREDVQTLFLEFATQPVFVVGDVDALDDLPTRSAEPAAEFHAYLTN